MKPDGWNPLETVVRNANPVPQPRDLVDSEAAVAVTLLIEQRRGTMTTTPTTQRPRTTPPPTPPRRWAWTFAAAFVVVLILGGAIAFVGGGDESLPANDVATTTASAAPTTAATEVASTTETSTVGQSLTAVAAIEIADAYHAAWNAADPRGVASLYTEDGLQKESKFEGFSGREQIANRVENLTPELANTKRTGDITFVSDDTFTFPSQYDYGNETWAGILEFEVRGTQVARSEWVYRQEVPTELVDAYLDAWNADDAGAVGALYAAESGVHIDPQVGILRGHDLIEADVVERSPSTTDAERTGDLTLSGRYTFTFPARFDRDGVTWAGVMEIDARSGFIFRTEWLGWSRID